MIKQHFHALHIPVYARGVDRCLLVGVLLLGVKAPTQEDKNSFRMT